MKSVLQLGLSVLFPFLLVHHALGRAGTEVYQLENPGESKVCQEAMAMTAMSKIDNKALAQLKRLLVNKDAVDVVDWGNKVAKRYPVTESYHYQTVKYDAGALHEAGSPKCAELTMDNITSCAKGPCLLDVLDHFYVKLTDPDRLDSYPLKYPRDIEFTDVDALKLVINLMTEIHNPMAFSMEGESKTKLAHGHVDVTQDTSLKTTAYDLGRGQVCDIYSLNYPSNWNSGWTHYQGLGSRYYKATEEEFGKGTEENLLAFRQWAVETAQMRCTLMRLWGHGFHLGPRDIDNAFRTQYRRLLLQGGVRMSVVIQKILDVQKVGALRRGSGVADIKDDVSYGKSHVVSASSSSGGSVIRTFFINTSILVIILGAGWFFLVRDPYASDKEAYGTGANDPKPAATGKGLSMSAVLGGGKDKAF